MREEYKKGFQWKQLMKPFFKCVTESYTEDNLYFPAHYRKTVLIGLGFFATCVLWTVYNAYVPLILNTCLTSTFLIGLVTALTNSMGAALHPVFGALSDKTSTPLGRRMPFLLIGIPLSAGVLLLIPSVQQLAGLLLLLAIFNAAMSIWRTPTFALIPDLLPSDFRSQANGVVNLMGGLGSLLALGAGGLLFNMGGMELPFLAAAAAALLGLLVMKMFLREPGTGVLPDEHKQNTEVALDISVDECADTNQYSIIAILCSLLFYSIGISAVETFFSLYATTSLTDTVGRTLSGGDASLLMGVFSLTFMIFSVPAGFMAGRLGRKKTMLFGLGGIASLLSIFYFINLSSLLIPVLIGGGICCSLVNINFLPAVTELAPNSSFGRYTGYYHLITFSSTIISPLLFGLVRDLAGTYRVLFLYSGIAIFAAIIPLSFVANGGGEMVVGQTLEDRRI